MTARDSSMYSILTCTVLTCIQFSVSSRTGIGIGIGIGQYYWVLGALFGIILTLKDAEMRGAEIKGKSALSKLQCQFQVISNVACRLRSANKDNTHFWRYFSRH